MSLTEQSIPIQLNKTPEELHPRAPLIIICTSLPQIGNSQNEEVQELGGNGNSFISQGIYRYLKLHSGPTGYFYTGSFHRRLSQALGNTSETDFKDDRKSLAQGEPIGDPQRIERLILKEFDEFDQQTLAKAVIWARQTTEWLKSEQQVQTNPFNDLFVDRLILEAVIGSIQDGRKHQVVVDSKLLPLILENQPALLQDPLSRLSQTHANILSIGIDCDRQVAFKRMLSRQREKYWENPQEGSYPTYSNLLKQRRERFKADQLLYATYEELPTYLRSTVMAACHFILDNSQDIAPEDQDAFFVSLTRILISCIYPNNEHSASTENLPLQAH